MDVIREYDISYKKITHIDDNYMIYLPKSRLCLKHVSATEWEIIAASAIIDYAVSNGFRSFMTIRKTSGGRPYIKENDEIFILTDEYGDEKLSLKNRKNIIWMTGIIAHFHNCAEGFVQPQGVKVKVCWGKRAEKYRTMTSKLEKYIYKMKQKETLDLFEEYTKSYADILLKRAKASLKVLRSLNYLKALEGSMMKKEVCINSISSNTVVIKNGKPVIVKVFDMGYNMCLEDLSLLIKKAIEDTGNADLYRNIINRYAQIRQLDDGMDDIIKAYVSFPYNSIKIIKKYMDCPEKGELLIDKFKDAFAMEQKTNIMEG